MRKEGKRKKKERKERNRSEKGNKIGRDGEINRKAKR
jgi:hypothetical protein